MVSVGTTPEVLLDSWRTIIFKTPIKFTCTHRYNRLLFSYRNERREKMGWYGSWALGELVDAYEIMGSTSVCDGDTKSLLVGVDEKRGEDDE